jgi:hypothetical protein
MYESGSLDPWNVHKVLDFGTSVKLTLDQFNLTIVKRVNPVSRFLSLESSRFPSCGIRFLAVLLSCSSFRNQVSKRTTPGTTAEGRKEDCIWKKKENAQQRQHSITAV